MVKIVVVGPGQVAHEVIDGLVASGKHEILLFSRRDATPELAVPGTTWVKVSDYQDKSKLVEALKGVHTVLSFVVAHQDIGNATQTALIDAAIEAGVKRFAPSEWAISDFTHLPWYHNKLAIRDYLAEKNRDKKVIEYTLFQPGWFLNYLAGTHQTAKHVGASPVALLDHNTLTGRVGAGTRDRRTTYTTISDFVNIVVKAIEFEGEWPTVGGINGHTLSFAEELAIGEKIRGKPYEIEELKVDDLKAGIINVARLPIFDHPSLTEEDRVAFSKQIVAGVVLHAADGHAEGSDEWNRIFPDYKFTSVEQFLTETFGSA